MDKKEFIARRVAKFFKPNDVINLGVGIPTMVADYIVDGVYLHTENGMIGYGPTPPPDEIDRNFINAGGLPVSVNKGASFFSQADAFCMIRGGHISAAVLGAFQVDENRDLANWSMPGRIVGIGGAMDLLNGVRKIIIAMEHTSKKGAPKIIKKCTLPLTGVGVVDIIVTDLGLMEFTEEGLVLKELAPGVSVEEIQSKTEVRLIIPEHVAVMEVM